LEAVGSVHPGCLHDEKTIVKTTNNQKIDFDKYIGTNIRL
jgi:hypothetical protein